MSIYRDIDYKLNTKDKDIKLAEDAEAINNSIRNILLTQKYSVPGNPDFGANLDMVLFEQQDEITFSLIESIIRNEIQKWEPRIVINSITFKGYPSQQRIAVSINYTILRTNDIENVTFKVGQ